MGRVSDNGILLVLVALVLFFSWATWADQPTVGRPGAMSLAREVLRAQAARRIVVLAGVGVEEREFSETVVEQLKTAGRDVIADYSGGPADVREQLDSLYASGASVDVIAGSRRASAWT